MKKRIFRSGLALLFTLAFVFSFAVPASAEGNFYEDSTGNIVGGDESAVLDRDVANELFITGQKVCVNDKKVDGNAFMAGYELLLDKSTIGGSAFMAGYSLETDATVDHNIWIAGYKLDLKENTKAKALYAAGNVVDVRGNYETAGIGAGTISFNGTVNGDVSLDGDTITIGKDAVINGTLTIKSSNDPEISEDAEIGEVIVKKVQGDTDAVKTVSAADKAIKWLKSLIYWILAFALLGLIFALFFDRQLEDAAAIGTQRTAFTFLSGFFALIAVPIALIILCVTYIGLPLAGFAGLVCAAIMFFSRVFTFASIVRHLIFSKAGKRLNFVAEVVLVVILAAVIKKIPYLGGITGFVCLMFTFGYVIQAAYLHLCRKKSMNEVANEEPEL